MSLYDDLSNSAYMEKDQFIKQLQLRAQPNPMEDQSLNNSQHMINYNHFSDSARVNQDDLNTSALRNSEAAFKFENLRGPSDMGGLYHNEVQPENMAQLSHLIELNSEIKPTDYLSHNNNYRNVQADLFGAGKAETQNQDQNYYQKQNERNYYDQDDENVLQAQSALNEGSQLQTGHFKQPMVQQNMMMESSSLNQIKNNNQELEKFLMDFKQQPKNFNAGIQFGQAKQDMISQSLQSSHQSFHQSHLYNDSGAQNNNNPKQNYGMNQFNFNQDNSLLALAQMPKGSHNDNNQMYGLNDQSSMNQGYYMNDEIKSSSQFNYPPQLATPLQQINQGIFSQNNIQASQNLIQQQLNPKVPIYQSNNNYNQQYSDNPYEDQENRDFNIFQKTQSRNEVFLAEKGQSQFDNRNYEQQQQQIYSKQPQKLPSRGDFQSRELTNQEQRKKDIMSNFDEIPIKELNKAEAYQTQNTDNNNNDAPENEGEPIDENDLPLYQRVNSSKWKLRMNAYKEINDIFYKEFTHQNNKRKQSDKELKANLNQDESETEPTNAFETYAPFLQDMLTDQNLVAQYEGLVCLHSYMRFAPDIKIQVHALSQPMFEKVQLNKQNFRDILQKIWLCILKRTQAPLQVILSKLKHKTPKIQTFAMEIIAEAMQNNILIDEATIKLIFKNLTECIYSNNKEIKDAALVLMKELYRHCDDDSQHFVKNLKKLRPVQAKEIKDMLQDIEKTEKSFQVKIFSSSSINLPQQHDNNSPRQKTMKQARNEEIGGNNDFVQDEGHSFQVNNESDLQLLVPENFNEIPYLTQINIKKKAMESFNSELERLVAKRIPVANKDYSQIFNIIVHMLEDSNALVFMEAIRCVEYLSILLGRNIKSIKLKQFIQLLTEKYKESKSSVTVAVNRTINQIVKSQAIPTPQLVDYLINTLANNNKNPRAKQLITEKVDQIVQEEAIKEDELISVFKLLKDKLINLIQKENNASVRDASVQLLTTFKMLLPNEQIINQAINALPKYRIAEINKNASERAETFKLPQIVAPTGKTSQQQQKRPVGSSNAEQQQTLLSKKAFAAEQQSQDFSYQGRVISGQYQIGIADIIMSIKNLKNGTQQPLDGVTQKQKWEDQLEKLGDEGVKEGKPVIVSCVHWLFKTHANSANFHQHQESLDSLMILLKTIYCIDRSIVQPVAGEKGSTELSQVIEIVLIGASWSRHPRQVEALLNVVSSAAKTITQFIQQFTQSLSMISEIEEGIDRPKVFRFVFKWLSNKLDHLLQKGLKASELETIQQIGQNFVDNEDNEAEKEQLTHVISNFANELYEKKKQMEYLEESSIQHSEDHANDDSSGEVSNLFQGAPQNHKQQQPMKVARLNKVVTKSKGQEIVEAIDNNFEQGLMLIKQLSMSPDLADFKTKEMIFHKLMQLVEGQGVSKISSQQQQYQQTYSLKALLWMKEEIMGLEDCFKLTDQVMVSYARTEMDGKDTSVELHLLNNWTKDLSLRDLVDRVAAVNQLKPQDEYFVTLFNWLATHKLYSAQHNDKWSIEDFRKLSLLLGKFINEEDIQQFFSYCVTKFGPSKVRDFMEIQLMHSSSICTAFIDWFSDKFQKNSKNGANQSQDLRLPNIQQRFNTNAVEKNLDQELQNALNISNIDESVQSSARGGPGSRQTNAKNGLSHLHERRVKRKNSINKKLDDQPNPTTKYEDIISRIESQLQSQQQQQQQQQQMPTEEDVMENEENQPKADKLNFQKTQSSNYYATNEKSNRYLNYDDFDDQRALDEDDEIINATARKLKESEMAEFKYRDDISRLEEEKQRIEEGRAALLREKNKQTEEWRDKYDQIRVEHADVISNLQQVNKCYLTQVSENEHLKQQLVMMQQQHSQLMSKFEQIETKLEEQNQKPLLNKVQTQQQANKNGVQIVKEEHIRKLEQAFSQENGQVVQFQSEGEQAVKKIQELLLNAEKNVGEQIGQPLYFLYAKMKTPSDRLAMIHGLHQSIQNEDVLFALSYDTYKAVTHFLLRVFAIEKARLDYESISASQSHTGAGAGLQNEVTCEVQKMVSILLNSKEFTTSLVIFFQLLREAMPADLNVELGEEAKQFLRVLMRCVSRITKALHSENPDLVRAFDVLIELQKIFLTHPPELLREDLPSLEDLDGVYRGLRDVSDKLIELHPEKVMSFLKFVQDKAPNAFTRYMHQMMNSRYGQGAAANGDGSDWDEY